MQVLLGQEPRDINIAVLLVKYFDPDEPLACHNSFHKPEVETPDHNNTQNDRQRRHDNPVLNIINAEDRSVNTVVDAIIVFVLASSCLVSDSMILLQERVEQ